MKHTITIVELHKRILICWLVYNLVHNSMREIQLSACPYKLDIRIIAFAISSSIERTHREANPESGQFKPNFDCNYNYPIDLKRVIYRKRVNTIQFCFELTRLRIDSSTCTLLYYKVFIYLWRWKRFNFWKVWYWIENIFEIQHNLTTRYELLNAISFTRSNIFGYCHGG